MFPNVIVTVLMKFVLGMKSDCSMLPNMIQMRNIGDIEDGDRLFYELGYKLSMNSGVGDNWVRLGRFREVLNISDMLIHDKRMSDLEYLVHHNFMLIKNGIHLHL